jgi:Fe2+ or Zn2+ uptake regulation protein
MTQLELSGVVRDVMRYFVQHPHAADSLEGIARWRLFEQRARDVVAETGTALQQLVEEGFLEKVSVAGGQTLYRLDPEKRDAARRLAQ